jgi:hypothetical protein
VLPAGDCGLLRALVWPHNKSLKLFLLGRLFVPNNSITYPASFCKFRRMQRAIIVALLLIFPSGPDAGVIKWEGKPLVVSISTDRLTRIEFPETLRCVFLSRSDIVLAEGGKSFADV